MALAARPNLDISGFFCVPSGAVSEEARAEAEAMLRDFFGEQQDDHPDTTHCPLCILVQGVPLPEYQPASHILVLVRQDITPSCFEIDFVYRPQGPPLGLRAPPSISL